MIFLSFSDKCSNFISIILSDIISLIIAGHSTKEIDFLSFKYSIPPISKNSLIDFKRYKSKWYKFLLFNLYSFKMEYVGDKISSENPKPYAKPLQNVVLPEPRSPTKKITEP